MPELQKTCDPPEVSTETKKMVCVFTQVDYYQMVQRWILLVKKRPGSQHEGMLNLPGGRVKVNEHPSDAALRHLKEETGLDGTFPQYLGCLSSDPKETDDPFIVYFYRVAVRSDMTNENLCPTKPFQAVSWYNIDSLISSQWEGVMPDLELIIPLCMAGVHGWILEWPYAPYCTEDNGIVSNGMTVIFPVHQPKKEGE